jgi:hypothetical protein
VPLDRLRWIFFASVVPAVCPVVATRDAGRNVRRERREQPWGMGANRCYQAEVHCYQR